MGKFSGMLICSDFDGTLAYHSEIPSRNVEAIKYFQQNGGLFTVISGRDAEFFDKYSDRIRFDKYLGCVNGTVIWDIERRAAVEEHTITEQQLFGEFTLKNHETWKNLRDVMIFGKEHFVTVSTDDYNFEAQFTEGMNQPVYKTLFHGKQPFTEEEMAWLKDSLGEGFGVWRSWALGIEIQDASYDKGCAARRIAELLGAKTLICVGDYENDIPLLSSADISYAAKSHHPSLTSLVHGIAAPCEVGAIASVIEDLDKKAHQYIKGRIF